MFFWLIRLFFIIIAIPCGHAKQVLSFGMTTTQEASGFAKVLVREMNQAYPDWEFSYAIAGTNQQLRTLKDGLFPFAITHNKAQENRLVAQGRHRREPLFRNDFLLLGPVNQSLNCDSIPQCLRRIAKVNKPFLSRGDHSGTHLFELSSWHFIAINPVMFSAYMIAPGGAANSLRICQIKHCYLLVDESTFIAHPTDNLTEVARSKQANTYSLIYATSFVEQYGDGMIRWLISHVGKISERFGYKSVIKSH